MKKIVTPESKIFDFNKMEILLKHREKNSLIEYEELKWSYNQGYDYTQLLTYDFNGKIFKRITIYNDKSVEIRENLSSYFEYYEKYYPNGVIFTKVVHSWLGFGIGMQYSYDENGRIIQEKNWNLGYDFTFEDILNFCKKNKIDLLTKAIFPQSVYKEDFNGIQAWRIIYYDPVTNYSYAYVLDGKTGEILWEVEDKDVPAFQHPTEDEQYQTPDEKD